MPDPAVTVVVPTRDRPARLTRLLAGLRAQTVGVDAFEVVVCDDASTDPAVAEILQAAAGEHDRGGLRLRASRNDRARGPAVARNAAWRNARAPLVAFIDDDCVPTPRWLEALLDAWGAVGRTDAALLQGPVDPDPGEFPQAQTPFSTTLWVHDAGPRFETANIAYPRALLERLDGFDESLVIAGEDTDLGWRAIEAGADVVWAGDALVHHGVIAQTPWARLAKGWRWRFVPAVYARHPGLRDELVVGVFWTVWHWWLFRAALALALRPRAPGPGRPTAGLRGPRRGIGWSFLRWLLAFPYVRRLTHYRTGPLLAPYRLACDLVEVAAIGVGAVRHRVPMI
ncbi:MAG: glycosyltransferase [Solirubrobacteraceae bacterium]|nr:glycosyltransferase [Solirubrobacteraceae bacterium]